MEYVRSGNDVLTSLVFSLCIRLGEAQRPAEIFAYRQTEERLDRLLLHPAELSRRQQGLRGSSEGGRVTLQLTHDELTRRASMRRQHVIFTLGKMRRDGPLFVPRYVKPARQRETHFHTCKRAFRPPTPNPPGKSVGGCCH